MTGLSMKLLQQVQDMLKTRFSMSELGPVYFMLGVEVIRDEAQGPLKLSQHKYILFLLEKFVMDSCDPVRKLVTSNQPVDDAPENTLLEPTEKTKCQAMVGSLIFPSLQSSRFDVEFSVSQVSTSYKQAGNSSFGHSYACVSLLEGNTGYHNYKLNLQQTLRPEELLRELRNSGQSDINYRKHVILGWICSLLIKPIMNHCISNEGKFFGFASML